MDRCTQFQKAVLHRACLLGHISIAEELLRQGADPNVRDDVSVRCVFLIMYGSLTVQSEE
jgi:hypothetical protein